MKRERRIIGISALVVIALVTMVAFAEEKNRGEREREDLINSIESKISEGEQKFNEELELIREYEWPAEEAYNRLLNYLKTSEGQTVRSFYGGAYFNDEKQLTVLVKGGDEEAAEVFAKEANYSRLTFSSCRYSYDELYQVYEAALDLWQKEELSVLSSLGVQEKENRIVVSLYPNDEESRAAFEAWIGPADMEMFNFVEGSKAVPAAYVYVGEHVNPTRSAGYRGYRIDEDDNIVDGFTSCGHSIVNEIYISSTKVSDLFDYAYGGSADISFYDKTPFTVLSNVMAYTDDAGNQEYERYLSTVEYTNALLENTSVFKVAGTTFVTGGTVHCSDVSFSTISHLIETTAQSAIGDSGGVLIIYHANQYKVLGSLHGKGTYSGITYTYFSAYFNNKYAMSSFIYRY